MPCSVRQELSDRFNFISLLAAVALPLLLGPLLGPLLCPLAHLVLSFCTCCCQKCLRAKGESHRPQQVDTSVSWAKRQFLGWLYFGERAHGASEAYAFYCQNPRDEVGLAVNIS